MPKEGVAAGRALLIKPNNQTRPANPVISKIGYQSSRGSSLSSSEKDVRVVRGLLDAENGSNGSTSTSTKSSFEGSQPSLDADFLRLFAEFGLDDRYTSANGSVL